MEGLLGGSAEWLWWGLPLVIMAFGLLVFFSGCAKLLRRPLKAGGRIIGGGFLTALGAAIGLVGVNLQTYTRLAYETPVAEVSVRAVDPALKRYDVAVRALDGSERVQSCVLVGDEWMLSARVQTWRPWVNTLGLNATYKLDQIANKYISAAEANGQPITACDISAPAPDVNRYVPAGWLTWLMTAATQDERVFGSANYMPLADGAVYTVVLTQMGLNSMPANEVAETANQRRP